MKHIEKSELIKEGDKASLLDKLKAEIAKGTITVEEKIILYHLNSFDFCSYHGQIF